MFGGPRFLAQPLQWEAADKKGKTCDPVFPSSFRLAFLRALGVPLRTPQGGIEKKPLRQRSYGGRQAAAGEYAEHQKAKGTAFCDPPLVESRSSPSLRPLFLLCALCVNAPMAAVRPLQSVSDPHPLSGLALCPGFGSDVTLAART
jgi:hypothetical protein